MSASVPPDRPERRKLGRWIAIVATTLGLVMVSSVFLAPSGAASQQVVVGPTLAGTTVITVPHPGWVTVHFAHPPDGGMAMRYWMQGGSGMMYDHSMMGAEDSYAFWSWGGTYDCGASFSTPSSTPMPVWVNTTWGPF